MAILSYVLVAVAAYLLGSIPTGYLAARQRGIDIRSVGSGNIGATNVFRALGNVAGSLVLVADGLKGWVACKLIPPFACEHFAPNYFVENVQLEQNLAITAGICAVLGHNYTCWLQFRGGKGIATSAGVYFALAPVSAGIAVGAWIVVFALSRYVSLASIAAAAALPTAVWLTPNGLTIRIVTTALGLLAICKHHTNVRRLIAGTENRVGGKKSSPPAEATP